MKTNELIRLLREADPAGDGEVSVGNRDIHFVTPEPAYYDGCQQVLLRNERGRIVGAKYRASGGKVVIHAVPLRDVLWDDEDLPVDYSDLPPHRAEAYRTADDECRRKARECKKDLELENWLDYVRGKAADLGSDVDKVLAVARDFFAHNLNRDAPVPADIPVLGESYVSRRHKQWDREVEILHTGLDWLIRRRQGQTWHGDQTVTQPCGKCGTYYRQPTCLSFMTCPDCRASIS